MEWLRTDGILSFSHIAAHAKSNPKLLKGTLPSVFSVDALPSIMLVLWPKWLLQLLTSPLHLGAAGKVDGKKRYLFFSFKRIPQNYFISSHKTLVRIESHGLI